MTLPRPLSRCHVAIDNIVTLRRDLMNKLLATLIAGTFAAVSTVAVAQSATPAPAPTEKSAAEKAKEKVKAAQSTDKAKAFDEKQKAAQDASRNSPNPAEQKANVDASKMQPRTKAKYDEKAAQGLSDNSATDPAQAKANVAASKASGPRQKIDLSKMSKQEKQDLLRQLQKESTGQ